MSDRCSRLSLRTKIAGIALAISTLSLAVVAAAGILQLRHQTAMEERRAADTVSLSFSRSAQMEMAAGDWHELRRLTRSFARDPNLLFIAAYNANGKLMTSAANDATAWTGYLAGALDPDTCIISRRTVEALDQTDESTTPATSISHKPIGTIVIGLSTAARQAALTRQNFMTLAVTTLAAGAGALVLFMTLGRWMRRLQQLAVPEQRPAQLRRPDHLMRL